MTGEPQTNGTRLRTLADNTLALIVARYVMPAILGILGSLMVFYLQQNAHSTNKAIDGLISTHEAVEVLISRFDGERASRNEEITGLNKMINDHETRIRVLERPSVAR